MVRATLQRPLLHVSGKASAADVAAHFDNVSRPKEAEAALAVIVNILHYKRPFMGISGRL